MIEIQVLIEKYYQITLGEFLWSDRKICSSQNVQYLCQNGSPGFLSSLETKLYLLLQVLFHLIYNHTWTHFTIKKYNHWLGTSPSSCTILTQTRRATAPPRPPSTLSGMSGVSDKALTSTVCSKYQTSDPCSWTWIYVQCLKQSTGYQECFYHQT